MTESFCPLCRAHKDRAGVCVFLVWWVFGFSGFFGFFPKVCTRGNCPAISGHYGVNWEIPSPCCYFSPFFVTSDSSKQRYFKVLGGENALPVLILC